MRRRVLRILFAALVIVVVAAVILWRLSWMAPAWYVPADLRDDDAAAFADQVEQALLEQTHRPRESKEPWRLRIREEQINVWLATRLPKWFAHERKLEWPDSLGPPQVRLMTGGVDLAIPVGGAAAPGERRVFVVRMEPVVNDDELSLRAVGFSIGRVGVWGSPLARIMELANDPAMEIVMRDEASREILELLSGERTFPRPGAKLADGRTVRLLGVSLGPGIMDLTLLTEETRHEERNRR